MNQSDPIIDCLVYFPYQHIGLVDVVKLTLGLVFAGGLLFDLAKSVKDKYNIVRTSS